MSQSPQGKAGPKKVKQRARILVVDDDGELRSMLRLGLEDAGFSVAEAATRAALIKHLDDGHGVDLITLDLMLGNENGLLIARQVRSRWNKPIVMITGRGEPIDRVTGLEHGADDYIVKPFHIREVAMRIDTVLHRYALENRATSAPLTPDDERYQFDDVTIDVRRRESLRADGGKLPLTDAEFDILVLFARNHGRVLSRDDLAMLLRGRSWSPLDRTIDGHIARLRKKIERNIAEPRLIKTVWRVGYVFAGEVKRLP